LVPALASARTWRIELDGSGDFASIQPALEMAADGDTLLLGAGDFSEVVPGRPMGFAYDIECSGYSDLPNLTFIGSSVDRTIIGPTTFAPNHQLFSPQALVLYGHGRYVLQDLTIRNCYAALAVQGTLVMERCRLLEHSIGIFWWPNAGGGLIRESEFECSLERYPTCIMITGAASSGAIVLDRCRSLRGELHISGDHQVSLLGCEIIGGTVGITMSGNPIVDIQDCRIVDIDRYGIVCTMDQAGVCSISNSEISAGRVAMEAGNRANAGAMHVSSTRLTGGTESVVTLLSRPGTCTVHGCELLRGSGVSVKCGTSTGMFNYDFTDNFWGTTDAAEIRAWIIDHADDPSIGATVLFEPFAGQPVSTEDATWGDLKALFR
jgi:hypothetical protein